MQQQLGYYMEKGDMESQIRQIILKQPGIRATDITMMVGRTKGRVSQVVKKLKDQNEIEAFRDANQKGLALRPTSTWWRRRLIRAKWGRDRTAKP